jgi:hypothetical protein
MKKWAIILSLAAGLFSQLSGQSQIIYANDDVFSETSSDGTVTTTYDGYAQSQQVVFGLAAANGVATGRRRSFIEFTIGPDAVSSATFMIYNYWGANMGGGGNPAGNGSLRLRATPVATPVTITEPTLSLDTTWVPPTDAQFNTTLSTVNVTSVGWVSIDVTAWYNARLGQTTTLQLHGAQVAGFDFPIYEDRENSAFASGADNTIADAGPRLVVVVPEPATVGLLGIGTLCLLLRRRMS